MILDANRLKFLMDGSFLKSSSQFELGSTFFYSKRYSTQRFEVDCLLTPFLYSYNNSEKMIPVIVNDFPIILYREYIARNINLEDLLSIYDTFVVEQQKKNINFDPALLKPEIFIKPKINYITEVLRQSCFLGKKIMAVVDINCAEFIANAWMDYGKHENLEKFQNLLSVSKLQNEDKNLTFSDYIQKHVILDLILDNFVQENFVQYKSFPFSGKGTVGRDMNFGNLFMIWNHFQRKFKRSQTNLKTLDDIKNGQETMADFEDGEHVQKTFKNIEKKMFR